MDLLCLPNELLLSIASHLAWQRDIHRFAQTNSRIYNLLDRYLYKYNVERDHSSALLWGAEHGREATVRKALMEGANIHARSEGNRTPLSWAAANGHEAIVTLLLSQKGIYPDLPTYGGETPLVLAAWHGHDQVVRLLLATPGVNPNFRTARDETPLSLATYRGHTGVVKQLLDTGCVDPYMQNFRGETPLTLAAGTGKQDLMKMLLDLHSPDLSHVSNVATQKIILC
ncbi:hypothetical protein POX_a00294 [Penicillium oxalicum]|uniref:F-box domain-containing protein n=1 Tax=Penicillium oxalicum (strain 114-2 / CGMCC 5302) TaxID=933388 RepID=S8A0S2_PENO1|nr:hypothetical protein POX_a00294 [Penicillium oxalicum]EPS34736.1 hypothetical protein PDE_09700 [Penicillium oxalicum 114-2]KAI2793710.1 hypothetical protein POX_a00294 [Penicillium oxalicum]